ncbi:uncharacterized protein M6B38_157245 [Iris pallida]|uniref:Amidohydrolase-related domain-containing protein n=1 Tax=Iris pallida TaxID=29817 RepID=A0AAX6F1H8_IRIPA|nr:uncharacterized protein M6B38_157245 [Iris pallida]
MAVPSTTFLSRFFSQKTLLFSLSSKRVPSSSSSTTAAAMAYQSPSPALKTIDSHLHIWASPQEAAEKYPYFPGQEPSIPGDVDLLLKCMLEAGVDGALIVQPINHMFDHSFVTRVLKWYPSKFIGCCLANPSEDGSGIGQLENLVLKDGYSAVRFNPYLWPSGQKMTNEIGKAMFRKAGELGVPVGFMCMKFAFGCLLLQLASLATTLVEPSKTATRILLPLTFVKMTRLQKTCKGLGLHISEIVELCSEFPSTVVLLDHMAFCKPPTNVEESKTLLELLKLSRFPQIYVKFSALFRLSRRSYPYEDTGDVLSQVISSFGANHVMWGSDFPFVVSECGYKEAKEVVSLLATRIPLLTSDVEWIMGRTASQLLLHSWNSQ